MTSIPAPAAAVPASLRRPSLRSTVLLVCGWIGPAVIAVAFAGWLIAGVLPFPLGPDDSQQKVVDFYAGGMHVVLGIGLASLGVSLLSPLVAAISYLMDTGGPGARLLSLVQLVAGTVTAVLLFVPMLLMAIIAFRPERDPEITVMMNDLAWLLFITPIMPFIIQNLAIAVSALRDNASPFPRWMGYLNCWIAFTFSFDVLALVVHRGPFAWNGLLIFWLALTTYSVFLLVMGLFVRHQALQPETVTTGEADRTPEVVR